MAVLKFLCVLGLMYLGPAQAQALRPDDIRQLTRQAAASAQITPGAKVCRRFRLGLAHEEWVQARVVSVDADTAVLRITDPGTQHHEWGGRPLSQGAQISVELVEWTLCR